MEKEVNQTNNSQKSNDNKALCCGLPIVPDRQLDSNIDPNRASLIRYIEKKWVNHTVLHYHFLDTPEAWQGNELQKEVVKESFQEWKDLGIGLEFKELHSRFVYHSAASLYIEIFIYNNIKLMT